LNGIENGNKVPYRLGHFFIAVNIEFFTEIDSFKKITGDILRSLRDSKKMKNQPRIYTAGEKEHLAWIERKTKGIPLPKKSIEELNAICFELGFTQYKF
ncbi:MAG TPA: Ldh family oxidoreductase, partial [bacterium]|nr:Ldh family oxidoreductase [bacterium]